MGSSVQGLARVALMSVVALLRALPASAQVPVPPAAGAETVPPPPPPPPAAEPAPATRPAAAPAAAAPPPLSPPPPAEPPARPQFLHTATEVQRLRERERPHAASREERESQSFFNRTTPWVDFTLTSFYLGDRVDNFLDFGVQGGAYLFEHLRVSGRLVVPLQGVHDSSPYYSEASSGTGSLVQLASRSVSVLYGASVGLLITNAHAFAFGPSVAFLRSDVEAYGTGAFVTLPFEWTTSHNLRVGFELGLGHAFDGQIRKQLCTSGSPRKCAIKTVDRQGATSFLAQFSFGYALGGL